MKLRITEILEYYDVPQLFVALDAVGTSYLCLTYDIDEAGVLQCLSANISKDRLNDFFTGHLDLRKIYLEPELFIYDVCVNGDEIDAKIRLAQIHDCMLPNEGYFLDYSQRENHDMILTSREEGRTIIRLAFNYETCNHAIPSSVLTNTIHDFQSILSKACKKIYKKQEDNEAKLLVRAPLAASFDLELMSEEPTNMFGGSKVANTLELIKPLFSDNDDEVAGCLSLFKDIQTNYKSFVKQLFESNVSFRFKWVDPSIETLVSECPLSKERIPSLYDLASRFEELDETNEIFEGRFFMANTKNGAWGFQPQTENRQKKGICYERTLLNGIVLNNQTYRISCTVRPSRNPNTGKISHAFILNSVDKVLE